MRIGRIINGKMFGKYDLESFTTVKEQKLTFAELCNNSEADVEAFIAKKNEILDASRKTGIDISAVGRWNHNVLEHGVLVPERVKSYYDLLETSIELGAKTFVTGINYDETISLYQNYTKAIEFFGGLCERAEKSGSEIKIAIQNCDWHNWIVSPREWEIVLGEIPNLTLKFDASHAYNRGQDYLQQLNEWGARVSHVHIKGTAYAGGKKIDDPPAGMDDIRWSALFAVLYSVGYNGDLSIEPHSLKWIGELGAKGVEFTRQYISQFVL